MIAAPAQNSSGTSKPPVVLDPALLHQYTAQMMEYRPLDVIRAVQIAHAFAFRGEVYPTGSWLALANGVLYAIAESEFDRLYVRV